MASTLAVGGVVTANAGVVVDNVTLDANKIATSSGNFTIDSASDIILDCDGANVFLKDDTTSFGKFNKNGNNLKISSEIQDGDIIFAGDDGGSSITALTLDMSDAGTATFNSTVKTDTFQNSSGNLNILSTESILIRFDSDNSQTNREFNIQSNSSTQLFKLDENGAMTHSGTASFAGAVTANAGVVVDNITIDGNEIDVSSGNFTLDVADEIVLDADGGNITLKDGGTSIGQFQLNDSNHLKLGSVVSDADIFFFGNDGGSTINALRLDMSDGG